MRKLLVVAILLLCSPLMATISIDMHLQFSPDALVFHKIVDPLDHYKVEYDKVTLGVRSAVVCGMTPPGTPSIGGVGHSVLLPPGATITDIKVVSSSKVEIPGEYNLYPVQRPVPFSKFREYFNRPKELIYKSLEPFPGKLVRKRTKESLQRRLF